MKTHISNWGSFGVGLRRYMDANGYVTHRARGWGRRLSYSALCEIRDCAYARRSLRVAATLELVRRDIAAWRAGE
jgi:hypothetical protein